MAAINLTNQKVAAWLSYIAYTDPTEDGSPQQTNDINSNLGTWIGDNFNGPYTLAWGPVTGSGILVYAVQDKNGDIQVACRGTIGFALDNILNWLSDVWDDADSGFTQPWPYQTNPDNGAFVTGGTWDAFTAIQNQTATNYLSGSESTLQDFLQNSVQPNRGVMVTGHSLGGGLANILAVYLGYYFTSTRPDIEFVPFTFAAPTVTNDIFANNVFNTYCKNSWQCVNANDNIPRAWSDLSDIATSYTPAGASSPVLESADLLIYTAVVAAAWGVGYFSYNFTPVAGRVVFPTEIDYTQPWTTETWLQHMLGGSYFTYLGLTAPSADKLPSIPYMGPGAVQTAKPLREKIIVKAKGTRKLKLTLVE